MNRQTSWTEDFVRDGYHLLPEVFSPSQIEQILLSIEIVASDIREANRSAGVRNLLTRSKEIYELARSPQLLELVGEVLGKGCRPVKAILFDKTPDANWYVTWHQDVTIAVKEKVETIGFGAWSVKEGVHHVQPPVEILDGMLTLRIHLDECPLDNGALKVVMGSQNSGLIDQDKIPEMLAGYMVVSVPAQRGDVLVMRPLLLHSSSQSKKPQHRRVLHVEYAATELPNGLKWAEDRRAE